MRIEHLAIWADNIELLRNFYMKYFDMQSNEMYTNEKKDFILISFHGKVRIVV